MVRKKYKGMNDVPIGTEIIHRNKKGKLVEITQFPTMFRVKFDDDSMDIFLTYEIEIIGWSPNE